MSFNVLVIPEDPTLNGHILKPLAERLLKDAGKPKAKVKVLDKPRVRGYDQAVKAVRYIVAERYGFVDLSVSSFPTRISREPAPCRIERSLRNLPPSGQSSYTGPCTVRCDRYFHSPSRWA